MSTCARCGVLLEGERHRECSDADTQYSESGAYIECLERQLSNQSALLRSVTAKLEEAATLLDVMPTPGEVAVARELVNQVLEVLA